MAATVYMRVVDSNNDVNVNLLTSKTKVAPLKIISLPRLELSAAVLLSKLIKSVRHGFKIEEYELFLWSDSTITLSWLKSQPYRWKTFVANRITTVLDHVGSTNWRHVSTEYNPADLATRGTTASNLLKNDLWWHGPPWLSQSPETWPQTTQFEETSLDMKSIKVFLTCSQSTLLEIFGRYSNLSKALRVLGYVLRFINSLKKPKVRPLSGALTSIEIARIKTLVIVETQKSFFSEEYADLESNHRSIHRTSIIANLNPFIDENGIMRVMGRLVNADLPIAMKCPIILPYHSHFTKLLIDEVHTDTLHGGIQLMITTIRKWFWIPRIKTLVKSHIFNCMVCFRHRGETLSQLMGALPRERLTRSLLFTNVGIDYAGPISIKTSTLRNAKVIKSYVCVFICFATKAIHLEGVSDLSTQAFLAAFRRFISRRPLCRNIFSDNGTNFVGANAELKKLMKRAIETANKEAREILANKAITWHFIPPGSPHMGGLWEAGVKQMKHHLKRVMSTQSFTFEQLITVLCQIEACLNSRPLCPRSDDPSDLCSITPGHIMYGEPLTTFPEPDYSKIRTNALQQWEVLQKIRQEFWNKWSTDYIAQFHKRNKWRTPQKNVQVGDLVILKEENLPPLVWKLGRITEVHPGKDNLIRVVTLKTDSGECKRPVHKLCYLPFQQTDENPSSIDLTN